MDYEVDNGIRMDSVHGMKEHKGCTAIHGIFLFTCSKISNSMFWHENEVNGRWSEMNGMKWSEMNEMEWSEMWMMDEMKYGWIVNGMRWNES